MSLDDALEPPVTAALRLDRLRPVLARCLPFAFYMAFLAFASLLAAVQPGIDLRWLYAVQITVVVAALVYYRRDYVELARSAPAGGAD